MISQECYELGSKSSIIREIFSFGLKRKAEVGEDKVYDFSLGNPSIPAPPSVKQAILELLEEPAEMAAFLEPTEGRVHVPGTDRWVNYDIGRRTGIALSKLGASRSIAMGAYLFALNELDK